MSGYKLNLYTETGFEFTVLRLWHLRMDGACRGVRWGMRGKGMGCCGRVVEELRSCVEGFMVWSMISIVAGTNRSGSLSLRLAIHLAGLYQAAGVKTTLIDLTRLPLEALAPEAYRNKPVALVEGFLTPLMASKGTHWVVPEYNGSFPGVLKVLIDHLPFPQFFEGRPAAFVGLSAGLSGATRPVEHLQQIMAYRNGFSFNRRVFIPSASLALDADGVPVDHALAQRLREQVTGFSAFCDCLVAG